MKYVLVYEVQDYPELGGGTTIEEFEDDQDMHKRVNDLNKQNSERYTSFQGLCVTTEYEYKAAEIVTFYKPVEI